MTGGADPVLRVQRRILDQAGHENVTVEESVEWVTITDSTGSATLATMRDQLYSGLTSVRARRESTPIHDALALELFAAQEPRPSLWRRTPDWVIGAGVLVLLLLVAALPVMFR